MAETPEQDNQERENLPETVELLVQALGELAVEGLEEDGSFLPAGAVIEADGEVQIYEVEVEDDDDGEPEEMIAELGEVFVELRDSESIQACAFSAQVRVEDAEVEEGVEAILVSVETAGGEALDIFLPYTVDGDTIEVGEAFASPRALSVFADPGDA